MFLSCQQLKQKEFAFYRTFLRDYSDAALNQVLGNAAAYQISSKG